MQERPAINRVQPNYVDKMDFVPVEYSELTTTGQQPEQLSPRLLAREPVFYTQTTLIAKPTHGGFTGLTSYNTADKVRWEVTEDFLIARQAWEYIHGATIGSQGIGNNPQNSGDVVAVFRIQSHFDIRREYNPTTGEELNVIEENGTDRPWYQRRYMHVDWSQNLIDGYNSVFEVDEWQGRIQSEPVPIYINNPQDPNRPQFEYSTHGTNRQLDYFDIVNRAILHPETTSVTFSDGSYPRLPACFMDEPADCAPAEVTMRVAFRRLDPQRDYEPAMVSNPPANAPGQSPAHLDMERFGFFDQNRVGYDRDRHTILDTQRVHWASRHNLWLWHHALYSMADAPAPAAGTLCNADSECGDGNTCRIGNAPRDATHRGVCTPFVIHHLPAAATAAGGVAGTDITCQSDNDCIQAYDGTGVSRTAVCDTATHTCGEHFVRCAVDQECQSTVDPHSYCDLAIAYTRADNRGLCTMPFRQRQVRQVAYHETENYPVYMQPVTNQIVHEWNDAFHTAVRTARIRECQIDMGHADGAPVDGADPCDTPAVTGADSEFPFVGCHSPVWGTAAGPGQHTQAEVDDAHAHGWDLPVCGWNGTLQGNIARIGDLRYSQIGGITDHDVQGYWGLANIASDPETGEMVVGRGAVWQTITDFYASWLVDLVKVLNGELTIDDLSTGVNFAESLRQLGTGNTPANETLDQPLRQANSLRDIATAHTGLDQLRLPDAGWFTPASGQTLLGTGPQHTNSAIETVRNRIMNSGMIGTGVDRGTARLTSLAGTSLESMMMNTQQTRLVGNQNPDDSAQLPQTIEHGSPFRGQSVAQRHLRQRMEGQLSAWQCNYDAAFSDDMLLGLAQRLYSGAPISCSNPSEASICFGGPDGHGGDWVFNQGGQVNYALIQQYAASFIHHGVLAHEIGHSLGQRHNFTASADAVNYFDNYWQHRAEGHHLGLRPRYEYLADPMDGHYYSQAEIDGRTDEWAYSSVMDYKGLNEDAHGIGRYDYAFIANGYTNLVQAFRQVANMGLAQQYSTATAGAGFSTPIDLTSWQSGVLHGMHYTQIPAIFGTNAAGAPNLGDDNRYYVFLHETNITGVTGWGDPAFTNMTNDGHLLVPYRFDSDERAGLVWQDQRYDAGGDAFESLHYVQERFLNYYFQNAYGRYRTGFSAGKYVARMWSRYLDQIHQTTQLLSFDLINFGDFFSGFPSWNTFLTSPTELGGIVNFTAMSMTADTLATILTMPEMGTHNPAIQPDGQNLVAQNQLTNAGFNIPINEGRAFESNWRNEAGFFWYEQLNRAGAYYDKVMAVQAMTDPELALLGRDTPTDIRQFQLSMYTMYPAQMLRFFGGLLSEDFQDFAPIVETSGTAHPIQRPHIATINLPGAANGRRIDATHQPIDPQDHFTLQLWSAVQTIAQFPATYDQRYMDSARLWVDGGLEATEVTNPAVNTVAFEDPWSHETYRALHIGAAAGEPGAEVGPSRLVHIATGAVANEAGIGARMLLHLADLDHQRTAGATTAIQTTAEQAEHRYIELIHVMRNLTAHFGTGQWSLPSANGH